MPTHSFREAKLDALLKMYETQMKHFESMRSVEWRLTFSIWTLLVAAIYAICLHPITIPPIWATFVVVVLSISHCFVLHFVRSSQRFDKYLWIHYRAEAMKLCHIEFPSKAMPNGKSTKPGVDDDSIEGAGIQWTYLEMAVTVVLGATVIFGAFYTNSSLILVEQDGMTWVAWSLTKSTEKTRSDTAANAVALLEDKLRPRPRSKPAYQRYSDAIAPQESSTNKQVESPVSAICPDNRP